jgi:DNA-binding beta-propeller fold protein YncE
MKKLCTAVAAFLSTVGLAPLCAETMVLGGYPDQLMLIDQNSGQVQERVTLATGLPTSMHLSNDRSRIYVTTITTSGIEVMDTATNRIINSFSLNTPTTKYRFSGGVPDPTGRYFYIFGTRIDKQLDAYRISDPQYMVVDLQQQKVVRSVPVAAEDQGPSYRARLALSPDGKTLYVFREKVIVIDTETMEVVDRIDLAKPDFPGMQDISVSGSLETLSSPGEYVSLFNSVDPYIRNKVFGIARFDLQSRHFNFAPIGPAPDSMAGLQVAPDGKNAYTVAVNGERGNARCEFWHFDLTRNIAVNNAEFPCRSRFYFGMSPNGEKLYIYGAGFDVAVYDAQTLKAEADWELTNDATMAGMLFLR